MTADNMSLALSSDVFDRNRILICLEGQCIYPYGTPQCDTNCDTKMLICSDLEGYLKTDLVPRRGYNIILHKIFNYQCFIRQFTNQM